MPTINTHSGQKSVIGHPNECPFCHSTITPNFIYGYLNNTTIETLLACPNIKCKKSFIGYYPHTNGNYTYNGIVTQGNLIGKDFTDNISNISPAFIEIYNQAYSAEQQNLTEICGVGYRKALEFLIKDYIILNNPEDKDKVEKKMLGPCIKDYVNDDRIKGVAKRAVWLGNDETHYIRKWEGKNLQDLKKLIDLTVHWIEMESLTKSFEDQMPEE